VPAGSVICEEKPDARELQQVVVNRLQLMWEGIDARNRETEVRVELVGNTERVCLKAKPKETPVAVELALGVEDR
jgi:hypothetical protein